MVFSFSSSYISYGQSTITTTLFFHYLFRCPPLSFVQQICSFLPFLWWAIRENATLPQLHCQAICPENFQYPLLHKYYHGGRWLGGDHYSHWVQSGSPRFSVLCVLNAKARLWVGLRCQCWQHSRGWGRRERGSRDSGLVHVLCYNSVHCVGYDMFLGPHRWCRVWCYGWFRTVVVSQGQSMPWILLALVLSWFWLFYTCFHFFTSHHFSIGSSWLVCPCFSFLWVGLGWWFGHLDAAM